jgi:hypothetical protein
MTIKQVSDPKDIFVHKIVFKVNIAFRRNFQGSEVDSQKKFELLAGLVTTGIRKSQLD